MLFAGVFDNHAPLVTKPLGANLLLLKVGTGQHGVQVHPHRELFTGTARADRLADAPIDHPFEVRNAIRLLVAQHPHHALGRGQLTHERLLVEPKPCVVFKGLGIRD
ncbi:MAG: hypothetical protein A2V70_04075 [Planctomycetes bacterium RBG_13_63_9]|nr:MAG: hypothetical protein A2V70_04075 [Planctomycetes bacterium RBG_13_63_9]